MSTVAVNQITANVEVYNDRVEWLIQRKRSIGASESPALFGVGYENQSPVTIYCDKLSDEVRELSEPMQKKLEIGSRIEPFLRESFFHENPEFAFVDPGKFTIYRSCEHDFMTASLDGLIADECNELGVLELKNVHHFAKEDWSNGNVPIGYMVQVQQELYVTGLKFAYIFALVGGQEFVCHRIERNDKFIKAALVPACCKFWECVTNRELPEVDDKEATTRALKALHPDDNGETIELTDSTFMDHDKRLEKIKALQKKLEKMRTKIENEIISRIGPATYLQLASATVYSFKTQEKKPYFVAGGKTRVLRRKEAK